MRSLMRSRGDSPSCSPNGFDPSRHDDRVTLAVSLTHPSRWIAAALLASGMSIAACGGSEERVFDAQELVTEIDEQGAGVALGPVMTTTPDGAEVYAITFTEQSEGVGAPIEQTPTGAGGGTMLIAADTDAARDEFERCEQTGSLTCFRAANAILRFEQLEGADQARLSTALESIATISE